jgi:prepilin-type N-terminal cleavage/methylation domain-containing protein
MKMYNKLGKRGFTLVELLTVMGIIAVLAAIIFPVMATVREQARKNSCMTNLRQIASAVRIYQISHGSYPESLGPPVVKDAGNVVIPIDSSKNSDTALYPGEINSISVFHCLSNPNDGKDGIAIDSVSGAEGYTYNSYDYFAKDFTLVQQYRLSWASGADADSAVLATGLEAYPRGEDSVLKRQEDYARQLKWRNPPDNTVIAWCMFHCDNPYSADSAKPTKGKAIVVFKDGHTEIHEARDVNACMWRLRPKG